MKCRLYNIFRILLVIYLAGVAYLCFGHFGNLPDIQKTLFGIPMDKVVHFCMFFPAPLIGFFAFTDKPSSPGKALVSLICICSFSCIFAGLTEIVQGTLPYRSEDIRDFEADCLAIGIATVLTFLINLITLRRAGR
jgi:VanZ family protein